MALSPTLWRTARVLAGETRLGLLRRIVAEPGQTVSRLADSMELSLPRASQELRRLQSRGLVQASRSGATVEYRPIPDPLVASAKPILDAMKSALAMTPESDVSGLVAVARAFSHVRRLAILQELQLSPRSAVDLQRLLRMSQMAAYRHLAILQEAGLVRRKGRAWMFDPGVHPLSTCLARLLKASGR